MSVHDGGRFMGCVKGFHWGGCWGGSRCDPGWCSCRDISRAIASRLLLSPFKGEADLFCGQCGVLPA